MNRAFEAFEAQKAHCKVSEGTSQSCSMNYESVSHSNKKIANFAENFRSRAEIQEGPEKACNSHRREQKKKTQQSNSVQSIRQNFFFDILEFVVC
jgi:hypothetical protein